MPKYQTGDDVTLAAQRGCLDQPVHEVASELCAHRPEIVWREPVPTRKRLERFAGLWSPTLESQAGLPDPVVRLDEAKLFWSPTDSSPWIVVHLVSGVYGSDTAGKARCAVFWDGNGSSPLPDWLNAWLVKSLPKPPARLAADNGPCWSK